LPACLLDHRAPDPDRARDVLEGLLAKVLEGDVDPLGDLVVNRLSDADAADVGQLFESGGDVDTVAIDIAFVEDNVPEIDADAELDASVLGDVGVAATHSYLDFCCAAHRV
jgi:hypothetical protein